MASKREKLKRAEDNARAAYDKKIKKLTPFGYIAAGAAVLALLLCFCSFIYIYNVGYDSEGKLIGVEIKVSGWKFLSCFLTGNYTAENSDMQVFYYYSKNYVQDACMYSFIAIVLAVATLFLGAFSSLKNKPVLGYVSVATSLCSGILFIVSFVLCTCNGCAAPIIATYCSGNPLCSVKSLAILPALAIFGACAVSVYESIRFIKIKKQFAKK